jgi:toxin ParE1/3/4
MQVKWLRRALRNLEQEVEHIASDDPIAAGLVAQRIEHGLQLLSDNPSLGHPGRVPGTYELIIPKTRYIIPYRVRPRLGQIEILRVFHTSRKPPERW